MGRARYLLKTLDFGVGVRHLGVSLAHPTKIPSKMMQVKLEQWVGS